MLADIFESFIVTCYEEDRIKPFYVPSFPSCTWDAGLVYTKLELESFQEVALYWILEKAFRGGISGYMGKNMLFL